VAAALLVAGFVVVLLVVMRFTEPPAIDLAVQRWFQDRRTPLLTTVFRGVTALGSPVGLIITVAVVAGTLSLRRRSWQPLLISAVTLGGAELIGTIIKVLVGRDRPPLADRVPDVTANGLDFPSGHSTQSAAAYTILVLLIAQQVPHRFARVLLYAAAAVGAGLVGVSRLYLGVHWFTDVMASWCLGLGWTCAVVAGAAWWGGRAPAPPRHRIPAADRPAE
jgi:undecaprenyl-diphosphatase